MLTRAWHHPHSASLSSPGCHNHMQRGLLPGCGKTGRAVNTRTANDAGRVEMGTGPTMADPLGAREAPPVKPWPVPSCRHGIRVAPPCAMDTGARPVVGVFQLLLPRLCRIQRPVPQPPIPQGPSPGTATILLLPMTSLQFPFAPLFSHPRPLHGPLLHPAFPSPPVSSSPVFHPHDGWLLTLMTDPRWSCWAGCCPLGGPRLALTATAALRACSCSAILIRCSISYARAPPSLGSAYRGDALAAWGFLPPAAGICWGSGRWGCRPRGVCWYGSTPPGKRPPAPRCCCAAISRGGRCGGGAGAGQSLAAGRGQSASWPEAAGHSAYGDSPGVRWSCRPCCLGAS